jgi:PAS domain S-box-containing protein
LVLTVLTQRVLSELNEFDNAYPRQASVWTMFGGMLVALTLLLGAVVIMHFYIDHRAESTRRDTTESLNVELARSALVADIAAVTTDLMFIGRLLERLSFDPAVAEGRRLYLEKVFLTFAREKKVYDQIRFIGVDGRETVRINLGDGEPVLVPAARLQDKSGRYYVRQALQMDSGHVYVSPLDLNVEDGQVQLPLKPVLRFATPVIDHTGQRQGLVVLNYLGDRLLERFRQAAANIADHVQLLNAEGYWLSSPRPNENWGFMFGSEQTFGRRFPSAWRRIQSEEQGQFTTATGLFTFATVRPALESAMALAPGRVVVEQGEAWKVVAHTWLDTVSLGLGAFIQRHAGLYLGIFGLLALLAYLLASANHHRRTAEAQHAHEQRFRRTLEDIGLVALMVDVHGRLTFCNHFLLELTGWQRDEVIGERWTERFVPRDQWAGIDGIFRKLAEQGQFPPHFEGEICTRDGKRRLIAWNNSLTTDAAGRVIGLTGIGEDVTERRQAEEQVRKLSQAVEQSPAIVVITNKAGEIEYTNRKFTEVTGYTFDEVQGRNPKLLKSGETSRDDYDALWAALNRGGEWRGEFHNCRKDGSLYWEAAAISALRDAAGNISHFLAVKEDITERKRLEQEVDSHNRELARTQALAAMGQMSTMLAHDLRNPLSSVKMAVQILGKQAQSREGRELATIGQEQVRYMEDIINDMLTYSRPGELRAAWLEADKLIAGAISTVRRRIAEYGAHVEVNCDSRLPTFSGDPSKLRQLLSNLLVNAFQAVAERPADERHVTVTADLLLQGSGNLIRFRVCDTGEGIEAQVRDRLFEPFFTTRTKGTGLGLAIVRQIADLHNASIRMLDNHPCGTCVELTLPVIPATAAGINEPAPGRVVA